MKYWGIFFLLTVFLLFCSGCSGTKPSNVGAHTTQTSDVEAGEDKDSFSIADFSGTELETYDTMFSEMTAATLYVDGKPTVLELDDPRLIRLLNFLGGCVSSQTVMWTQGWLDTDWMESVESNATRLEIEFQNTSEEGTTFDLSGYDRMIVCNRHICCVSFVNTSDPNCYEEGKRAMGYWPNNDEFASNEDLLLLEYAGFI